MGIFNECVPFCVPFLLLIIFGLQKTLTVFKESKLWQDYLKEAKFIGSVKNLSHFYL